MMDWNGWKLVFYVYLGIIAPIGVLLLNNIWLIYLWGLHMVVLAVLKVIYWN